MFVNKAGELFVRYISFASAFSPATLVLASIYHHSSSSCILPKPIVIGWLTLERLRELDQTGQDVQEQ